MTTISTTYAADTSFVNTSGTGQVATIPDDVRGLCWGGFLTPLFWGIGNSTWIVLLTFIPYIGWIVPFVILFKGNEWAWRNRTWQDVEQFKRHQRRWAIAGLIINMLVLGALILLEYNTTNTPQTMF